MKIKRLAAFVLGMAMVVDVVPAFVFADTIDLAPNSIVVAEETEAKEEEKSESSDKKETSDSKDKKDSGSSAKEAPKSEDKKDTGSKDKKAAEPKENAEKSTKESKDKGSDESGDKTASKTADKEETGSKDKKEAESKDKENSESGNKEKDGTEDKADVNTGDKEKNEATEKTDVGTGDKEDAGSKANDGAESGDKEKAESGDKDEVDSKDKEEAGSSEDKEKADTGDKEEPAADDKAGTDTDVKESDVSENKEPESTAKEDEKEPGKKGKIIHGQTPIQFVKGSGSSDNDALFNNYVSAKLGISSSAKGYRQTSVKAGDRLKGKNKNFYNVLKPYIVKVANGDYTSTYFPVTETDLGLVGASWTAKDLGLSSLLESDGKTISKDVTLALANKLGINFKAIMEALLADCAYEQYWFNKAIGMGFALSCNVDTNGSEPVLKLGKAGFVMYFTVAKKYAANNDLYTTNPAEIKRANTAVKNAAAIVKQAKDKSDYDKLVYYRNWICANNVYNNDALSLGKEDYGDPWQIIYVFDKDPKTNVVCEGYSKAFKYLFDQTDFKENISCITVSGDMKTPTGGGGHMWNIVKMSDGKNYLVDVTNSDNKYTGGTDLLFFVGMNKGSNSSEYYINLTASYQVRFTYDSDTVSAFDAKDLVLSSTRYVAPNSLSVSGKTAKVKKKKVRKKKQTLAASKVFSFKSKGQGKLTYRKISGSKKIKINGSNGKVTVKKKTKKGTYKVTVLIKAAGTPGYRHPGSKKVTFRIKVK